MLLAELCKSFVKERPGNKAKRKEEIHINKTEVLID